MDFEWDLQKQVISHQITISNSHCFQTTEKQICTHSYRNPKRAGRACAIQAFARHADAQVAPLVSMQAMLDSELLIFSRCCLARALSLSVLFSMAISLPWLLESWS